MGRYLILLRVLLLLCCLLLQIVFNFDFVYDPHSLHLLIYTLLLLLLLLGTPFKRRLHILKIPTELLLLFHCVTLPRNANTPAPISAFWRGTHIHSV